MRKHFIIGPLYWGDTYLVIENDVIELSTYQDHHYILASKNIFDQKYLIDILEASAAETSEELFKIIPNFKELPNWLDIVLEIKQLVSGHVAIGMWESFNCFYESDKEIRVYPTRGVQDLIKSKKKELPIECKVIMVKYSGNFKIPYIFL
jgi:hypothetical protein